MKSKWNILWIFFWFFIIVIIISVTLIKGEQKYGDVSYNEFRNLTYEKCCDGVPCTDTYYDEEEKVCVLTLCVNNPFIFNKEKCRYEPK